MTAEPPAKIEEDLVQHLSWVRRVALALVRDPELADDLAQQAAADWAVRRGSWAERRGGLRAWLAKAARSLAVDRGRSERARRRREAEVAAADDRSTERPDEVVARLEQQRQVAAMVQQLPEPYRTTIVHRYLDEWTTAVVAVRMGVPEATVRKRVERGLGLLRERLDGEFGARSKAWCLGLLEPSLRRQVEAGLSGGGMAAVGQGMGIMGGKALVGLAAGVVAVACGVWIWTSDADAFMSLEVGGRGVVVPAAVAAAREEAVRVAAAARTEPLPKTSAVEAGARPRVHGMLFVDGEHRAPPDLAIETTYNMGAIHWDAGAAVWSIDLGQVLAATAGSADQRARATTLWITSAATVPAQVPIPAELFEHGGTFDLHLTGGRSLALLFRDEQTGAPLPALAFEVCKQLEISRQNGGLLSRSGTSMHRTDADGRALVQGIPDLGAVNVLVDFVRRERQLLMRDGEVHTVRWPAQPVWSMNLEPQLPRQLEATILATVPLGDAVATGQVPAWAIAAGAEPASVRVVVRERAKVGTDASGLGDRYALPVDPQGEFVLTASAPSRHIVWLERTHDGTALSPRTEVVFERAGPQSAIVFAPLQSSLLTLRLRNVPATGVLEIVEEGGESTNRPQRQVCAGNPFTVDVPVVAGSSLRISLLAGNGQDRKSGWSRHTKVEAGSPRELVLDLAGSWRSLELRADGLDVAAVRAIALHPCRAGQVVPDERIVAICDGGRVTADVHVPPGRWLFVGDTGGALVGWGVVDVPAEASGPLVLCPRLLRVPAHDLRPAFRLDAIEGVSLQALPERLRTVQVPVEATEVLMPLDAVPVRLPR